MLATDLADASDLSVWIINDSDGFALACKAWSGFMTPP